MTHRESLIRAGEQILKRAMDAKARGVIKDFIPVYQAKDPEIIDHIQLVK